MIMFIKKFGSFIFKLLKYTILFTIYCRMPDKYDGKSYEDWLKK